MRLGEVPEAGPSGDCVSNFDRLDPDWFLHSNEDQHSHQLLCWLGRGRGERVLRTVPRLPQVALQQKIRQAQSHASRKSRGRGRARIWKDESSDSMTCPGKDGSRGQSPAESSHFLQPQIQVQVPSQTEPVYIEPPRLYNGAWMEHEFPDLSSQASVQSSISKKSEYFSAVEVDSLSQATSQLSQVVEVTDLLDEHTQSDQHLPEELSEVDQIRLLEKPKRDSAARPKTRGSRLDFVAANTDLLRSFMSLNQKRKITKVLPLTQSNLEQFLKEDYNAKFNHMSYVSMYCDRNQRVNSEGEDADCNKKTGNDSGMNHLGGVAVDNHGDQTEENTVPKTDIDVPPYVNGDQHIAIDMCQGIPGAKHVERSATGIIDKSIVGVDHVVEGTEDYAEVYFEEARSLDSVVSNLSDNEFDIHSSELDEALRDQWFGSSCQNDQTELEMIEDHACTSLDIQEPFEETNKVEATEPISSVARQSLEELGVELPDAFGLGAYSTLTVDKDQNETEHHSHGIYRLDRLDEFENPSVDNNYYENATNMAHVLQAKEYCENSFDGPADKNKAFSTEIANTMQCVAPKLSQDDSTTVVQGKDVVYDAIDDEFGNGAFQVVKSKHKKRKPSNSKKKKVQSHKKSDNSVWRLYGLSVFQVDGLMPACEVSDLVAIVSAFGQVLDHQMIVREDTRSVRFKMQTQDDCDFAVECLHDAECLFTDSGSSISCYRLSDL